VVATKTIDILQQRLHALDTWRQRAIGAKFNPEHIRQIEQALHVTTDPAHRFTSLHTTILTHPESRAIDQPPRTATPIQRSPEMSTKLL